MLYWTIYPKSKAFTTFGLDSVLSLTLHGYRICFPNLSLVIICLEVG